MLLITLDFPGVGRKRRADEWIHTRAKGEGVSIDLEPNARVSVPLDSPAIRDRLDDGQTPPTPQVGPRARLRRHLEARARVAYPPAYRIRRDRHRKRDVVIGRKPGVTDTVGHQLAHHQPDILELLGRQETFKLV